MATYAWEAISQVSDHALVIKVTLIQAALFLWQGSFLVSPGGELLSPHEECQVRKLWLYSLHLQQDKALSVLTEKNKKSSFTSLFG